MDPLFPPQLKFSFFFGNPGASWGSEVAEMEMGDNSSQELMNMDALALYAEHKSLSSSTVQGILHTGKFDDSYYFTQKIAKLASWAGRRWFLFLCVVVYFVPAGTR